MFFFFLFVFFFFKQKTAYEMIWWLEFRRVLFRSRRVACDAYLPVFNRISKIDRLDKKYQKGYRNQKKQCNSDVPVDVGGYHSFSWLRHPKSVVNLCYSKITLINIHPSSLQPLPPYLGLSFMICNLTKYRYRLYDLVYVLRGRTEIIIAKYHFISYWASYNRYFEVLETQNFLFLRVADISFYFQENWWA